MKKSMGYSQFLGNWGESAARSFIQTLGYDIIVCNYKVQGGEIDIIACDRDMLVFVEVKTRSGRSARFGTPAESVDVKKQTHIIQAAQTYIYHNSWEGPCRFDVIEVYRDSQVKLQHIQDAFTIS